MQEVVLVWSQRHSDSKKGQPLSHSSEKGRLVLFGDFTLLFYQESDYLRLVYHLYDSEGSDSEDEADRREKRERLAALEAKLK